MKIKLIFRNGVFVPCYEDDYEKARKLKHGSIVNCDVKLLRNPEFNKKYHKLVDTAWNCLNEQQIAVFGEHGKEAFRKSLEMFAGFYDPAYNFKDNNYCKIPRSTSFDSMDEDEFETLYQGVYDAIRAMLTRKNMSETEFDAVFEGF